MTTRVAGCYNCDRETAGSRHPREEIVRTQHWRVGHAFNVTLPGWLVMVPTWHATSFSDLSEDAMAEFGVLVGRLSQALRDVTGCVKTYVMQFSEAEGYAHLHVHLVPRMSDHPVEARGPNVFTFMTEDSSAWVPDATQDELAQELRSVKPRALWRLV